MKTMKKLLSIMLVILMCFTSISNAYAANEASIVKSGTCGDNITWTLDSAGTLTLSGSGEMVPDEETDGDLWLDDYESIKNIVIADGITSICGEAFAACTNIKSIDIPDSVTEIGAGAFLYCVNLRSVKIGSNVESIGEMAFAYAPKLKTVTIANGVKNIGYAAFYFSGVEKINIPASVESMDEPFPGCFNLKEITVDENNENYCAVDNVLFNKDMTSLITYPQNREGTTYKIPDSVKYVYTIGSLSKNLKSLVWTNEVTSLPDAEDGFYWGAYFKDCDANTIEDIEDYFTSDSVLDKTDSFTIYGKADSYAQSHATGNGFNFVDVDTFTGHLYSDWKVNKEATCVQDGEKTKSCYFCDDVKTEPINKLMHMDENKDSYCDTCGEKIETTKSGTYGDNITWTLDSTGTLTLTGTGAMRDNDGDCIWTKEYENLTKIVIGEGITSVGALAFFPCFYVKSVELPSTLEEIRMGAFAGCGFESITIPNGVKTIGYGAFLDCEKLKEFYIPASVEKFGLGVFEECEGLEKITVDENNKNFKSVDGVLYSADMKKLVVCPAASCGSSFTIPSTVETILGSAFSYCNALESINIPFGVKNIDSSAFYECKNLSSVTISGSVESIGTLAFCCPKLKEVTIPLSVKTIDEYAFGYRETEDEMDIEKIPSFKISGYTNSAAETYANDNGFEFVSLGEHTHQWNNTKVDSTCTVKGYEVEVCSGCSAQQNYKELPLAEHSYGDWSTTKSATCNSTGTQTRKCTSCDKTQTKTIDKLTHVFTDWTESKKATMFENGEMTRTCTLCKIKETKATDKLPSTEAKDEKTGISFVYSDDSFEGTVEVVAEQVSSGTAYNVVVEETSCSRLQLFDISAVIEDEKVQPNGSVWVKVPLPSGYNASKTAVYYVGEDGKLEKMNSFVDGEYICFEATHFSPYAVVDESSNPDTCSCNCHKGGIKGFFFKILNFFQKLFGKNKVCACGVKH